LGTGYCFVHHRIVLALKRVEFVSNRASYIVLRGRWFNIIVMNVHAPNEEKSGNSNDSFYEKFRGGFFYHFLSYGMKSTAFRTEIFINTSKPLLMGRLTTKLTTG